MTDCVFECDVLVIGGGPAGSTAAHLLASWGRSVTMVHRPTAPHLTLAESLPASTRKLLRFLGQLDRVEAAGFYPNTGNRAEWAGTSRVTTSADAGFHVGRETFDRVLRDSACAAGARLIEAAIQRVHTDDPVRVSGLAADGRAIECRARYLLDCSGRAGVIARRGLRRLDAPYRTLAIVAEWLCEDWPAEERTSTTIESYCDGWAWSVPLSPTRRQCTVMVDPRSIARRSRAASGVTGPGSPGVGSRASEDLPNRLRQGVRAREGEPHVLLVDYERELAKATVLNRRLARARRVSAPWTCDASIYDCERAADGPVLLVGDAASFIEPLSSAGVKKALLSAWRAAIVANTCLAEPAMAGPATDLHVRRERDVYNDCLRRSSAFFAEASGAYGTAFWSARAQRAVDAGASTSDSEDTSDDSLVRDESVRAAFERLRSDSAVRLRPATTLQFASVPAIDGHQVVMREAIVVPGRASPLHYAAGVDLARLARIVSRCNHVPGIIVAYQDNVGPVPINGVLAGLSLLVARRALVAEEL